MVDLQNEPLPPRPTPTKEQKDLMFSSAPLLAPGKYGLEITKEMYAKMLDENPELKDVFSHSKQVVR